MSNQENQTITVIFDKDIAIASLMERVNQLEASLCELQNVVYQAHDMQVTIQGVIEPTQEAYDPTSEQETEYAY